jgi:hypothetical protein
MWPESLLCRSVIVVRAKAVFKILLPSQAILLPEILLPKKLKCRNK